MNRTMLLPLLSLLALPSLVTNLATGAPPAAEFSAYGEPVPGTDDSISMIPVSGGHYLMGSRPTEPGREDPEGPQHNVSVGDLWQTPPEDSFLLENHAPVMSNYNEAFKGVRVSHNRTVVLEIKALRSYLPMIVDGEEDEA